MTAQPAWFHGASARPPRVRLKVAEIRRHLKPEHRAAFNGEMDEAVDTGDITLVNAVKQRWWGQALIDTDPDLEAGLEAAEAGEVEYFPSPFANR